MLKTGDQAPDFSSVNQENKAVSLSDFSGVKNLILYFYPKDDTPGCTIEANGFSELADEFTSADTVVLGVSKDGCFSHLRFIDKFDLKLDLLADTTGELCELYGVWQEKERDGIKKMGIVRSSFVIDKSGKLVHVEYGVNPEGHAQAMLALVRGL